MTVVRAALWSVILAYMGRGGLKAYGIAEVAAAPVCTLVEVVPEQNLAKIVPEDNLFPWWRRRQEI
jgi:hypothetical protein